MLCSRFLIASTLAAATALATVACGGGGETSSAGAGGGGGGDGTGGSTGSGNNNVGLPPGPGPEKPGDGPGHTLAVNKVFLGDTDRSGAAKPLAWMKYGFNLDKTVSSPSSSGHCKPQDGAEAKDIQTDGDNGIDNAFGKDIVPKLGAIVPNPSQTATNEIVENGTFTIILKMDGLGDAADYNPLTAKLYAGAELGKAPAFDGSDEWPVLEELLNGGDVENPKIKFTSAYVVDNLFVSGAPQNITLNLAFGAVAVNIEIQKALLTMKLAGDRKGATEGMIGGIVETEPLIEQIKKVARNFGFCDDSDPTLNTVIDAIRSASDIMADGSQDPNATCNGISIGLGFEMKPVKVGEVVPAGEPPPDECGTGGGSP